MIPRMFILAVTVRNKEKFNVKQTGITPKPIKNSLYK